MSDTLVARGSSAPSSSDWEGELSAYEAKAETDSLADLQARRRKLLEDNGRLLALHGNFGLFDDYRKQALEAQKVAARMRLEQEGVKTTDKIVESEGYGAPAYQALLDHAITDKIAALTVQNEIKEIEERIEDRKTALYLYGAEMRLGQ